MTHTHAKVSIVTVQKVRVETDGIKLTSRANVIDNNSEVLY